MTWTTIYKILKALKDRETGIKELGKKTGTSRKITLIIAELEQAGYVETKREGKYKLVKLTPKGQELIRQMENTIIIKPDMKHVKEKLYLRHRISSILQENLSGYTITYTNIKREYEKAKYLYEVFQEIKRDWESITVENCNKMEKTEGIEIKNRATTLINESKSSNRNKMEKTET